MKNIGPDLQQEIRDDEMYYITTYWLEYYITTIAFPTLSKRYPVSNY